MDGPEIHFSDERVNTGIGEMIATPNYIYLCSLAKTVEQPVEIPSFWGKKAIGLGCDPCLTGPFISIDDSVFFANEDRYLYRMHGTELDKGNLRSMMRRAVHLHFSKAYKPEILDVGTDGERMYVELSDQTVLVLDQEFNIESKLNYSEINESASGTGVFYQSSGPMTWDVMVDGIKRQQLRFGQGFCDDDEDLLDKLCKRGVLTQDEQVCCPLGYLAGAFSDGNNLYGLSVRGDVWWLESNASILLKKAARLFDVPDPSGLITATNHKYGVLLHGNKLSLIGKGHILGSTRLREGTKEVFDMAMDERFVYVLTEDAMQRYYILE
ncbi:MAG: hypothetical protein KKG59_05895 [Nanoarchaeota archaeon]|nr:hypothetical protein [Nanoarchaeota archaeon]